MLQVPIEILILDNENTEHVSKAINVLHKVQNTFKYSILKNTEIEHKIHSDIQVHKIDVYDYSDKYKSIIRGYHPHLICVTNKYIIGSKFTNLFASLERKKGILTGNGIVTSYQVKNLIEDIPISVYFMFYLISNPLRFILKERICNDKIRSVLSIQEIKSVREALGFISDVANSKNPNQFFIEAISNYKIENDVSDEISNQELDEAITLLKKSKIDDAFDKVSLLIKKEHPK